MTANARSRCENSINEWMVPVGKSRPGSQVGHVEQPSPDPVPRTSPPTVNSATVVAAVARASFWNRVIAEIVDPEAEVHYIPGSLMRPPCHTA
jgi:hypothetical protein